MKRHSRENGFLYFFNFFFFLALRIHEMFARLRPTYVHSGNSYVGPMHRFAGNCFEGRRELHALAEHEVEGHQTAAQAL